VRREHQTPEDGRESAVTIVGDLAVLVFVLAGQVRAKPLSSFKLPLILVVIGALEAGSFLVGGGQRLAEILKGQRSFAVTVPDGRTAIVALIGSLVIAAVGAAIRVPTFRLWWQDGQYWRKGTAVTVVLWLVCLGAHLLYEGLMARDSALSGLGAATTVLYFGVSLGIQRVLLAARTVRIAHGSNRAG
jgi:hypothetical protein